MALLEGSSVDPLGLFKSSMCCSYNILNVIFRAYHEHMTFMLDTIGASSDYLANNEIVKVNPALMPRLPGFGLAS